MSKPANKTFVGVFVLGALALVILAIGILGSGKWFTRTVTYVMFFDGSVKGLNIGSPVMFRGVRIGSVKNIELQMKSKDFTFRIPVYAEIEPSKINFDRPQKELKDHLSHLDILIDKGLRATLELQSIVTGQLMVNLDFVPDKPGRLVGVDKKYPEIPTVPSMLEDLLKTAQDLPLRELFSKFTHAVEGIDRAVNSPEMTSSLKSLSTGLKEMNEAVLSIKKTSDELRGIIVSGQTLPQQLGEALESAKTAFKQAEKTLTTLQDTVQDNSILMTEINSTLDDMSGAARSIRGLADTLQRQPESLLKGKKN